VGHQAASSVGVLEGYVAESDCGKIRCDSNAYDSYESFVYLVSNLHCQGYSSADGGSQTLHLACLGHSSGPAYLGQAGNLSHWVVSFVYYCEQLWSWKGCV
jgi:hypothetical protein